MERLIPLQDGSDMIVAPLYGYSGASSDATSLADNEKVVAAALLRCKNMTDIPYYPCTELNINPDLSHALQATVQDKWANDIFKDIFKGTPPPTYREGGVAPNTEGSGTTRIDAVFVNAPAAHACTNADYQYLNSDAFDHVPLRLTLNTDRYSNSISVAIQPAKLGDQVTTGTIMQAEIGIIR